MKKTILSIAIALVTIITTNAQSKESKTTNVTFGVRGNCGMCKATIEGAIKELKGVTKVNWDVDNKKIDITYDDFQTNLMELHTAIANSGYDTDMSKGNDTAYENLASCCQYDRKMKMSLNPKKEDHSHSGHKH